MSDEIAILKAAGHEGAAQVLAAYKAGQAAALPPAGDAAEVAPDMGSMLLGTPGGPEGLNGEDANLEMAKAQLNEETRQALGPNTTSFGHVRPEDVGMEMSARLREAAGMDPGRGA